MKVKLTRQSLLIKTGCIMLMLLLFAIPVLAAGGSGGGGGGGSGGGSGSGSGGGGDSGTPLALEVSEPKEGAKNVATDAQIKLTFSKNVVNMQVKENNVKCFSLQDSKGQAVPIDVKMADDQMEPDAKNDVIIVPRQPLAEDEKYTVVISPDLQAKSGAKMEKEVKVSFTTAGGKDNSMAWPLVIGAVILIGGYLYIKNKKK